MLRTEQGGQFILDSSRNLRSVFPLAGQERYNRRSSTRKHDLDFNRAGVLGRVEMETLKSDNCRLLEVN
jgi:hypothetical protein